MRRQIYFILLSLSFINTTNAKPLPDRDDNFTCEPRSSSQGVKLLKLSGHLSGKWDTILGSLRIEMIKDGSLIEEEWAVKGAYGSCGAGPLYYLKTIDEPSVASVYIPLDTPANLKSKIELADGRVISAFCTIDQLSR